MNDPLIVVWPLLRSTSPEISSAVAVLTLTCPFSGDAGLRTGEMIALEWSDIDFRRSLLHVNRAEWEGHIGTPKGGRARTVNMTSRLAAAFERGDSYRHRDRNSLRRRGSWKPCSSCR